MRKLHQALLLSFSLGVIGPALPAQAGISCKGLSLNDCRDLIDSNKIVGAEAGTILREAAQGHLDQANPDEAILFLTIAESREPNSALTQKLWGDAYVMLGEEAVPKSDTSGEVLAPIEFIEATQKYIRGLGIDPGSAANFRGAVLASTRTGDCDLSRLVQQGYAGRFVGTSDATLLESFLDEKC